MRVVICDTVGAATDRVVGLLVAQIRDKPQSVLGLATGGAMERVYGELVCQYQDGLSFAGLITFNLDEYVGLAPEHPQSYADYMRHRLFDHINIDQSRCFIPNGTAHPTQEARAYEALIAEHGPIDFQLLGLGRNGHIGFNEPSSSLGSSTREKALTQDTLEANKRFFSEGETMPVSAITMGVKTICSAQKIVLLAFGSHKAQAVKNMIEGPLSAFCPASVLQMHPNATVVIDADAAQLLELKDHYLHQERIQRRREIAANGSGFIED